MIKCLSVVALLFSSTALHAQDIPPIEAWTRTDGTWSFDGRVGDLDYVWRYSDHTLPRTLLFIIEQIAAPNLAQDNVVAWAYHLSEISDDETRVTILNQIASMEVALAIRNPEDSTYYVLPNSQRDTLFPGGPFVSDAWDLWVVSPEERPYHLDSESARQLISNWNESPLAPDSMSLPWQTTRP